MHKQFEVTMQIKKQGGGKVPYFKMIASGFNESNARQNAMQQNPEYNAVNARAL